jgi:hypothetical protein
VAEAGEKEMNAENFNIEYLLQMAHSPIRNYVIPGLTSYLIGSPSPAGTMRLFRCSRDHQENITPHSHRFDFQCWVLRGRVKNRIWSPKYSGDAFMHTNLVYEGDVGKYRKVEIGVANYGFEDFTFSAGECYSMKAKEVHSIYFAHGTDVLFFEGPMVSDQSMILEPRVDGETVNTFEVKPWMFRK